MCVAPLGIRCEPSPASFTGLASLGWSRFAVVVALAGCAAASHAPPVSPQGMIAGVARDHDSGDPIAKAAVHLRARGDFAASSRISDDRGGYLFDHLAPGRYSLTAEFAGQPIDVENIEVRSGETTYVDLTFTLGRPDPIQVNFGDASQGAIDRYKPHDGASLIEGTVNDIGTHERVVGAVVTATRPDTLTLQTISDDAGRYRFEAVAPGTYSVSAYYSISGRGQIEVRRSGIKVAAAEAVVVPLWIELAK
jgi:hypothetical protein